MIFNGSVHKYGDNVNTDVIIPARYLNTSEEKELAAHCMEDIDADFSARVKPGDIIVAGKNFGCGSSREHAPLAIKASGISCVIAESFARIFYRNCINIGLPILECPDCFKIQNADMLKIETDSGKITIQGTEEVLSALPFPDFIEQIIRSGGLLNKNVL
ncbi:MAG: 3-isopropylmalate dehydratase small subunit [Clostridiales bacterium]|nr:3-isopropylmalate dehydratase small subunit [Clostridiales bacterium]